MAFKKLKVEVNKPVTKTREGIGALWIRQDRRGEGYYRGFVEVAGQKVEVVAFDNSIDKKNPASPDVQLYLHVPLAKA